MLGCKWGKQCLQRGIHETTAAAATLLKSVVEGSWGLPDISEWVLRTELIGRRTTLFPAGMTTIQELIVQAPCRTINSANSEAQAKLAWLVIMTWLFGLTTEDICLPTMLPKTRMATLVSKIKAKPYILSQLAVLPGSHKVHRPPRSIAS